MKKYILLLGIILLGSSQLFAQKKANTGDVRPVHKAHWDETCRGKAAKHIYSNQGNDGYVDYNCGNYDSIYADVIDSSDIQNGYEIKFAKGYFADWNRNWMDLRPGDIIFWMNGAPEWYEKKGYLYADNAVLADCGNPSTVRKPMVITESPYIGGTDDYSGYQSNPQIESEVIDFNDNGNTGGFGNGSVVITEPLDGTAVYSVGRSEAATASAPNIGTKKSSCEDSWRKDNPDYFVYYDAARSRGYTPKESANYAFKKVGKTDALSRKDHKSIKKCVTGKTYFRRNYPWIVASGLTAIGGGIYAFREDSGSGIGDPGYEPGNTPVDGILNSLLSLGYQVQYNNSFDGKSQQQTIYMGPRAEISQTLRIDYTAGKQIKGLAIERGNTFIQYSTGVIPAVSSGGAMK